MKRIGSRLALYCFILLASGPLLAVEPIKIGVLAFRPKEQTQALWSPLAAALNQTVAGFNFEIEAYTFKELQIVVAARQVDFVLTNPGNYVLMAKRSGLSAPMATLVNRVRDKAVTAFGGAIFARADREDINYLSDIRGKTVSAAVTGSLGGYQMQAYELNRIGLHMPQDVRLVTTGMPQDNVVAAVLEGRADVGFVRSGMLESLVEEGKLDLSRIKVINRQDLPDFPVMVSTALYPEWVFAALPHSDRALKRKVASFLLSIDNDKKLTDALQIQGFDIPSDYASVEHMLFVLRMPPYDELPQIGFRDLWRQYASWLIVAAASLMLLAGTALWLSRLNRRLDEALRRSDSYASQLRTLIHALPDLIYLKDVNGVYLACNSRFERFFGVSELEIVGKRDADFAEIAFNDAFRQLDTEPFGELGPVVREEWVSFADDGHRELLETIKMPMYDVQGRLMGVLGIGHDITAFKEYEQQLKHIAHYDALTQLPNRVLLADRLQQAMVQARRRKRLLVVAYLDLDGFKAVNDRHGHGVGDQLLMTVSGRMKQCLRAGDTLARLGGDEFVAVLADLDNADASLSMVNRLLNVASEPVHIGEHRLQVSASLGLTAYPQGEEVDPDQLLRQADQAMYQAKLSGKNRYHMFDAEHDRTMRGHHESIENIRQALVGQQFVLYYQPKLNLRTGDVIGAEALIRWQHPERGLLPPAEFLPVIEGYPLDIDLGEWVIDTALTQMEVWREKGLAIPVSVNVSARQLQQADFVERLRKHLAAHPGIDPSFLELEVLETSALEDIAHASNVMNACRDIGVGFALDDFGTGYSSLIYLKRLPAQVLKIDQGFVRDMLDDPDDLAILEGVISLAVTFRRNVIAEGVETIEHGEMLLRLGCEFGQGYGIAKPMPAEEMPAWVAGWAPVQVWAKACPLSRDDLPVLYAAVEYRAWIAALIAYLRDERERPPPLDFGWGRFDKWLKTEASIRYGAGPSIDEIESYRCRVHQKAMELCELKKKGQEPDALRLTEFQQMRDVLIASLQSLVFEQSNH